MTMGQQHAFDVLIELTQTKSDDAATKMAKMMKRHAESEKNLQMLRQYRDDYLARFEGQAKRGATAADLANFRAFIAKLDEAVSQQANDEQFWQAQVARARAEWQAEQKQLLSYTTIAERRRSVIEMAANRREQKTMDEFASRASRGNPFAQK